MMHSTICADGRRRVWLITHKLKCGEAGHFSKAPWLSEASPLEEERAKWGEAVGLLGVALLAGPAVAVELTSTWSTSGWAPIQEHMLQKRAAGLRPLRTFPYKMAMAQFPKGQAVKVPQLALEELTACSMHRTPPRQAGAVGKAVQVGTVRHVDSDDSSCCSDDEHNHAQFVTELKQKRRATKVAREAAGQRCECHTVTRATRRKQEAEQVGSK